MDKWREGEMGRLEKKVRTRKLERRYNEEKKSTGKEKLEKEGC